MPVPGSAVRRLARRGRSRLLPELGRLQRRIDRLEQHNARLAQRVVRLEERKRSLRAQLDQAVGRTTAVPAIEGVSRLELRRACALASTGPDARILEIGPAHNAIFAKRDGFDTRTVDYLDREGLIDRYASFEQYSPDDIEEVDYVLPPGAAMSDIIPDRFDLVMASHVIEHTTSMIDFLNECSRLLAPGGVLALVVPDHRYCFDRFRERASIARVIEASLAPPPVHTVGAVVEEKLNATRHRGTTAWMPGHRGKYELIFDAATASADGEEARRAERYIDTHNWVCTPHHLRLLLQDLHDLGLTSLREVSFHDTVRHEFFINLASEGPGTGLTREELLVLSENERRSVDVPTFKDPGQDVG